MNLQSKRRGASRVGGRAGARSLFIHRFLDVPGASPLPREQIIPTLITLDGTLPPQLAQFCYSTEKLN